MLLLLVNKIIVIAIAIKAVQHILILGSIVVIIPTCHMGDWGLIPHFICRSSEEENFSQNKTLEWRDCACDLLQILNLWM